MMRINQGERSPILTPEAHELLGRRELAIGKGTGTVEEWSKRNITKEEIQKWPRNTPYASLIMIMKYRQRKLFDYWPEYDDLLNMIESTNPLDETDKAAAVPVPPPTMTRAVSNDDSVRRGRNFARRKGSGDEGALLYGIAENSKENTDALTSRPSESEGPNALSPSQNHPYISLIPMAGGSSGFNTYTTREDDHSEVSTLSKNDGSIEDEFYF